MNTITTKQAKQFETPIGTFSYERVPKKQFFTGVNRIQKNSYIILIASAWRALADLIHTKRKTWNSLEELQDDLRIEKETILNSNHQQLENLATNYPSPRVRKNLKTFSKELANRNHLDKKMKDNK